MGWSVWFSGLHLFLWVGLLCWSGGGSALAECPPDHDDTIRTAWLLVEPYGSEVDACNPDAMMIPASIIKLATALAALDILGPDFRFTTSFYIDTQETLYIKGGGDPLLVSEEIARIIAHLRDTGLTRIRSLCIDDSAYALEYQVPGREGSDNPYDAPAGATAVNFNTVQVRVDSRGAVYSAEPQTPTLPIMGELARGKPKGRYSLNVCPPGYRPEEQSTRHTAELFLGLMQRAGISSSGGWRRGGVPAEARLLHTHQGARTVAELNGIFLKYSNNFMANAVYLACGAGGMGKPVTWAGASRAVRASLKRRLGSAVMDQLHMVEGSGLSRENRVSSRAMIAILQQFAPHAAILREHPQGRVKSGTLRDVYNYAGYLPSGRPFVIMRHQGANDREAILQRLAAKH